MNPSTPGAGPGRAEPSQGGKEATRQIARNIVREPGPREAGRFDKKKALDALKPTTKEALKEIEQNLSLHLRTLCEDLLLGARQPSTDTKGLFRLLKELAEELESLKNKPKIGKFRNVLQSIHNLANLEKNLNSLGDPKTSLSSDTRRRVHLLLRDEQTLPDLISIEGEFTRLVKELAEVILENLVFPKRKDEDTLARLNSTSRRTLRVSERLKKEAENAVREQGQAHQIKEDIPEGFVGEAPHFGPPPAFSKPQEPKESEKPVKSTGKVKKSDIDDMFARAGKKEL